MPPFNVSRDVIEQAIAGQGFQLFKVKAEGSRRELKARAAFCRNVMRGPAPRIFIFGRLARLPDEDRQGDGERAGDDDRAERIVHECCAHAATVRPFGPD